MTTPDGYWIHDLSPFLLRFPEGWPVDGIRWYGLAYVAGFIAAWFLLRAYSLKGRSDWTADQRTNLMTAIIIGVAVGGRLGYMLLYDLSGFLSNPLTFFALSQGGMASHGGFVGVTIACLWFCLHYGVSFRVTADVLATIAPPGLFFGRIANFINGELAGKITDVWWAVVFPGTASWLPVEEVPPRHPSQLYEAFAEGLLPFLYLQWRYWLRPPRNAGQLAGEFLLLYAFGRIVCEVFREPDASLILGMSRGSFYSLLLIAGGVALIVWSRRNPVPSQAAEGTRK